MTSTGTKTSTATKFSYRKCHNHPYRYESFSRASEQWLENEDERAKTTLTTTNNKKRKT